MYASAPAAVTQPQMISARRITCSYRNDFSSSRGWVRATRALTQAQGLLARWFRFQPGEIDALDTDDLEMWLEQAEEQIKSEYGDKS